MPVILFFRKFFLLMVFVFSVAFSGTTDSSESKKDKKVLIFSKTNGYRHKSIESGIAAIRKLGGENKFTADATEDSTKFTLDNLAQYDAVIFLNPTMDVLGEAQQSAFETYIRKGGGFVGVHAAADCEYGWPWYVKLVGASFESHPKTQKAKMDIVNKKHLSTKKFPDTWEKVDEWYNYKSMNSAVKVLIKVDESSYTGGKNGANHPIAWYHQYEGGRAFYTGLGHTPETFSDSLFLKHLLGGIRYAMGK